MIIFCEECGEQCDVTPNEDTGHHKFQCRHCAESLVIKSVDGKIENRMNAAAELGQCAGHSASAGPLRILVVDDSRFIRRVIRDILESDPELRIVGEAENGVEALELVSQLKPDVITLDINMPVMDGLTTLKHIMIKSPRPTIMFSTLTKDGSEETFEALRYGAVDFLLKPSNTSSTEIEAQKKEIIEKIKIAAGVRLQSLKFLRPPKSVAGDRKEVPPEIQALIGIGAAEGGYAALLKLIPGLDPDLPAAFISLLYATPQRLDAFANYLSQHSALQVRRVMSGEKLENGICYLASGEEYITFTTDCGGYQMEVHTAPFPERQGSINRLFFSIAEIVKGRSAGVILTGRGEDGTEGLSEIKRVGGYSLVQDPQYCLWSEMPQAAIERGQADLVVSNDKLIQGIKKFINNKAVDAD